MTKEEIIKLEEAYKDICKILDVNNKISLGDFFQEIIDNQKKIINNQEKILQNQYEIASGHKQNWIRR